MNVHMVYLPAILVKRAGYGSFKDISCASICTIFTEAVSKDGRQDVCKEVTEDDEEDDKVRDEVDEVTEQDRREGDELQEEAEEGVGCFVDCASLGTKEQPGTTLP